MRYPLVACGLVALVTSALLAPNAWAAEGDPCTADLDCGDGYACNLPPTVGGGSSGTSTSEPGLPLGTAGAPATDLPIPPAVGGTPVTEPAVAGTCYKAPRSCTTDAECGEHYACVIQDAPSIVDCDVDGICTAPEPDLPTTGECEGVPVPCTADTDCPEASSCTDQLCTFAPTPCLDDTACPTDYQCLESKSEECSVSPCAAGQPCDTEAVCVTVSTEGFCFPAPQPCTTDGDCSGDWTCYDVPNEDAPPPWENVDLGCLPAGIVGALEGYVAVEGEVSDEGDSTGESAPVFGGNTDGDPLDAGGAGGTPPQAVENRGTEATNEDEGHCTVAAPGRVGGGAGQWILVIAGLVASGWRARRRAA